MPGTVPTVYLLHGEDEFAISQFLLELEAKLGDPATVAMNVTRLNGQTFNVDELLSIASTMPFLARRRIVVLFHPTARLNTPEARERFLEQLAKVPPTTALVLVEYHTLTDERDRRVGKIHWLEKWAEANRASVYLRAFPLPKGALMSRWIEDRVQRAGGQITAPAADLLASLVEGDPRLAEQEIQKLLAYVDYQRPVDVSDVEDLTASVSQGDVFVMVDALGNRNGQKALEMLNRLLQQQDPFLIFGMIVRQFRMLLLTREILDWGGQRQDIIRGLNVAPFVVDKLMVQAQHFKLEELEETYHQLLYLDEAMKTSQIPADLALDTLVSDFTLG